MAEQLILPRRVLDVNGNPLSGAKLFAYTQGTTTLETVYTDASLSTAHPSPLISDAGGNFPPVWHEGDHGVKIKITAASDVEINWSPLDPCPATSSATTAANISFTPTSDNPATNVQQAIVNATDTGSDITEKGSGFTVIASDVGTIIRCTAAVTASLTAAATLANGFEVTIVAAGGDVTIDPDGIETINGESTLTLRQGKTARISCDGTTFYAYIVEEIPDSIINITSSTASIEFDVPAGATGFHMNYDNFEPATADASLAMQIGVNGSGGAFLTTSSYFSHFINLVVSTVSGSQVTTTHFEISTQVDNAHATPHGYGYGEVLATGFNQASEVVKISGFRGGVPSTGQQNGGTFQGRITSTEDNFNAIKFLASSGNIDKLRARIVWRY